MSSPLPRDLPGQGEIDHSHDLPDGAAPDDGPMPDGAAGPSCSGCKEPLGAAYHRVRGMVVCPHCRDLAEGYVRGGSGLGRLARSVFLGGAACLLAAVALFWVMRYLHFRQAILVLPIGMFVGAAVRKGSRGLGGLAYQLLAVGLTYLAVGMGLLATEIGEAADLGAFNRAAADPDDEDAPIPAPVPALVVAPPGAAPAPAPPPPPQPAPIRDVGKLFLELGLSLAIMIARVPIELGKETPALFLFLILGMVSAWKLNRRESVAIEGPFPTADLARGSGGLAPD